MSVDKEKWQELAEKYNTKAKWADAILLLSSGRQVTPTLN